jgi:clan AA aspartic protease
MLLAVGLTRVELVVTPVGRPRPARSVDFLVDSGAVFSVLPTAVWSALRLRAKDRMAFSLADGTSIERRLSEARFVYRGRDRVSPVILGEDKDEALLGAVTLETLGLVLNPLSREVQPMRLTLEEAKLPPLFTAQ